jgi:four helix bundle protein
MKVTDFRDLNIWKLGKELVLEIYAKSRGFPREESYGLVSQMRRCAISIPSNIAEGFNRLHKKDYRRFLSMALGSCAELETQTEIAYELRYLSCEHRDIILQKVGTEARMIRSLIRKIDESINNQRQATSD